jgi:putative flippase GtrA
MTRDESQRTQTLRETTAGSGRFLAVGALLVAVLVGAYVLLGTPGLHTQVASAPAVLNDVTAPPIQPASDR